MKLRSLFSVFLFTAVVFFLGIAYGAESPYKIRIGFPSLAFSYMPFYVAQEKGIYKKYGIESEYIQMGTYDPAASGGQRQHQLLHLGVDGNFRGRSGTAAGDRDQLLRQLAVGAGHHRRTLINRRT